MIRQYISLNKLFKTWESILDIFLHYKIDGVINFECSYGDDNDNKCQISVPYYDITDFKDTLIDDKEFKETLSGREKMDFIRKPFNIYDCTGGCYLSRHLNYKKYKLDNVVNNYSIFPIIARNSDIYDSVKYYLLYGFNTDEFLEIAKSNDVNDITSFLSHYDANLIKFRKDTYCN